MLVILSFSSITEGANLHILLVGDTKSDLYQQSNADLNSMKKQSNDLAHTIDLPLSLQILQGDQVSRNEILNKIDSLKVEPDDLILFYFTGHGCRTETKKSQWPYLFFARYNQHMALDEVLDHLKAKKPRFALILADCCNNYDEGDMPETEYFHFTTQSHRKLSHSLKSLFRDANGFLVITGAEPGGYSWACDEGGILTNAFLDGLSQSQYHPSKNWHDIMSDIREKTRGIQRPQYALLD